MSEATATPTGYFIDWDGKLRPIDQPGKGLRCEVDYKAKYHESTWYPDEAAVVKAGIKVTHAATDAPIQISSND